MTQPELIEALRAISVISQVRIAEPAKGMTFCLVGARRLIHVPKLLQSRVRVTLEDVGRRQRLSIFRLEQKSRLAFANELLQ
jgi:hypothetical protein